MIPSAAEVGTADSLAPTALRIRPRIGDGGHFGQPASSVSPARSSYRPFGTLRFLLSVLVVLQHFQYLLEPGSREPFQRLGLGIIAVGVFFAISGFICAEAHQSFYAGRPWAFLLNRILRLVPPYLAALLLSIGVHEALWRAGSLKLWDFSLSSSPLDPRLIASSVLSLAPGTRMASVGDEFQFLPFVWSLRVEVTFYLAVAAYFVVLSARPDGRGRWPAVVATVAAAAAASAFALFFVKGEPEICANVPFFAAGVATFCLVRRRSLPCAVLSAVAVAGVVAAFYVLDQPRTRIPGQQVPIALLLLAAFTALSASPSPGRWWRSVDKALGDLSYPLYLNHYVVGITVYSLVPIGSFALYSAAFLGSILLAASMSHLVEAPLRRLRDAIRGQRL